VGWAQAATAAERTQPVQLTTLQMDAVSAGGSVTGHEPRPRTVAIP
jgi:hypothetical protein